MSDTKHWIWESDGFPDELMGTVNAYTEYSPYENEDDADYYKMMNTIMDWHRSHTRQAELRAVKRVMGKVRAANKMLGWNEYVEGVAAADIDAIERDEEQATGPLQ